MIIYKMSSINLISKTIKYVGLGKDDPSFNFDISGELRTDLLYLKNKIGIKNRLTELGYFYLKKIGSLKEQI